MPPVNLSDDSIAILIDCWKHIHSRDVYEKIVHFCYRNPAIKAIFVASYIDDYDSAYDFLKWPNHKERYYLPREDRLIESAHDFYSKKRDPRVPDHIHNWWSAMNWPPKKFLSFIEKTFIPLGFRYGPFSRNNNTITDDTILKMPIRADQKILPVWTKSQVIHLISTYWPQTKNIFMMGGAWTRCLRTREVGYLSIQEAINSGALKPDLRILSKNHTVTGHFNDATSWSEINHPAWSPLPHDSSVQLYNPWKDVLNESDFHPHITNITQHQSKERVLASQCRVDDQFQIGRF